MRTLFTLRNWTGLALLAGLLLMPAFAEAACLNTKPIFTYLPVVVSGAQSTVEISASAGCYWEVVSQPNWIRMLSPNRGYGSGAIVFQVLEDKRSALSPGLIRVVVRDLNKHEATALSLSITATRLIAGR
jgi:hypothetical protein